MARAKSSQLLAWPPLLYLAVFFVIPTAIVAGYSFLTRNVYGGIIREWSTAAWELAVDRVTLKILWRSVLLSLAVTVSAVAIGYPCALCCARLKPAYRRICVALIAFPLMTSFLLRIYGWINLIPFEWRGNSVAVGTVMLINYLPFMILPLLRACERIDPTLGDVALDLGATPWSAFWKVTWPLTRPGLWAGCALVFIPAAGEYLVPHFIGDGKVDVLGTQIVKEFTERRNWPYAAACAVWLFLLVIVPALISALRSEPSVAQFNAHAKVRDGS
jgi:spermidine/putrescine transport system permease protein